MKLQLLGWMHQKLQQKSPEILQDFTIGNSCTRRCSKSLKQQKKENGKSFTEFEDNRGEDNFEEALLVISESFHGFLSIGTLGSDPIISEPETPTFAMSKEEATKIKTEVAENDLKIITHEPEKLHDVTEIKTEVTENDKIITHEQEKLHDGEAKEEGHNESSGRNTHVSRSGKEFEGVNAEGYLFGSLTKLPVTRTKVKKEATTLAELFQRPKMAEERPKDGELFQRTKVEEERPKDDELQRKRAQKSSMHLMKKMLKKLFVPSKSFSKSTGGVSTTKNKLRKVQTILHRKVHPENSMAAGEDDNSYENNNESVLPNSQCSSMQPEEENSCPQQRSNNHILPQHRVNGTIASKNRERWIKTDADYLVLEL